MRPITDFHKRSGRPSGLQSKCKSCALALRAEWRSSNGQSPEERSKAAARTAAWRNKNQERAKASKEKYRKEHPEVAAASMRRFYERNPNYSREYELRNPGHEAAHAAKRRAQKQMATPPWADLEAIEEIYRTAKAQSIKTGMQWDVDHIIPLRNKLVCGLHIPANLQLLPAKENRRKGNRFNH